MSRQSKTFQLFNPQKPGPSRSVSTDWTKCCLCQKVTSEVLQSPAKSKRFDIGIGQGYTTLSANLIRLTELHELPMSFDLQRLNEGGGIESTLNEKKAMWHKSCYNKFNSTQVRRAEKRRSSLEDSEINEGPARKYTRQSACSETEEFICFFCAKNASVSEPLRKVTTLGLDSRVRKCALDLQDERLLAKLSSKDMVAQEAKYHPKCLVALYNKAAALQAVENLDQLNRSDKLSHGIALAELLAHIEEARIDEDVAPVFKLSDLVKLYSSRLQELGVQQHIRPHSTELKNRILTQNPNLKANKEGRDIFLAFNSDLGPALHKACEDDCDSEAICLARAAKIVRRDMFEMQATFAGSFDQDCQVKSVPHSLLALVNMIHNGPEINSPRLSQATLSTAQLLQYNSSIHRRAKSTGVRHSKQRETPLPIYVGLTVHSRTRNRDLINTLFDLGLSISYDRVLAISTAMNNRVCEQYRRDNLVCPPNLRQGLFTTAAIDNIDHNPSSVTATESFHGTGISLFQHPNLQNQGHNRREHRILEQTSTNRKLLELPDTYTIVRPLLLTKKDIPIPSVCFTVENDCQSFQKALQGEIQWLETVEKKYSEDITHDSNISWAAYHASQQSNLDCQTPAITAMLPLFQDDSKSVAMIRHSMDVIKRAVQELNTSQVPVITLDQPLYAIAKSIQWNWQAEYGEDRFVLILGGLHIEMAGLKVIGDWLEDSGWVEAIVEAKIASAGTADSFVKVSHVTRTRHAHQITVSSLHILLKKSYTQYMESLEPGSQPEDFDKWCERRQQESPHFKFWYTAFHLELLILIFIKSLRTADFPLYIECLLQLVPWFFCLDHTNYARWLSVHIRDMISLSKIHPEITSQFNKGYFVVHRTGRVFSSMAIDQAHEQNNAAVKSDGGAIGLTQNPDALRRWMVAGPELVRLTTEFEASIEVFHKNSSKTMHHDQTNSTQVIFAQQVKSLTQVIEEMGNPFLEESNDLLRLDTRDIADTAVASSICQAEELGKKQYQTFVTERLQNLSIPLSEPIRKNKLLLFSRPPLREKSKASMKVSSLKSDISLFSRLYIACQSRDGDLNDFFRHENQAYPPSLSNLGKLRQGNKADFLSCLENCTETAASRPNVEVTILDGAVVVNFLKPAAAKTFDEYAANVFLPYIHHQLQDVNRVDIVWDKYLQNSLKCQTRNKRGKGIRRRVGASTNVPRNWQQFLREEGNKIELFEFLVKHIKLMLVTDKQIVTTNNSGVICVPPRDTSNLAPCNHEEADTRMMVHLADALRDGFCKIMLRTKDTDVVVLAVAVAAKTNIQELWIAFGTGRNFRYIPIHEIVTSIGPNKSQALPMFHAYTGCDTVSSFATKGKKTAWDTWKSYNQVTTTFLSLSAGPDQVTDEDIAVLERFTILLYDRTSDLVNIDEARKHLFTKKGRAMDAIPPTKAALVQHIKRAVYQGGHCWGKALQVSLDLPSPGNWGWTDSNNWKPLWTTLPEASTSSRELVHCGCKKGCRGQCKCKKAALRCTALCFCSGECDDN